MNVEQLMTPDPATCRKSETLEQAASRMWEHDCGALPVLDDDGLLAGMVTDRDICMAAYTQGKPLSEITVESAASKEVFSVSARIDVSEAERLMQRKQIRRVPVVNGHNQGALVGILSLNDIARATARSRSGVTEHEVAETLSAVCQPRSTPMHATA